MSICPRSMQSTPTISSTTLLQGFLPRSEYLPRYQSGELKVNKSTSEGREVRVYGDTAIVTGIVHVDATIKGENRNLHLRYLNVWVKRGDGWVLVARQATNLAMPK